MRLMNWAVTRDDGERQREITMRKVNMIWGGIVCLALLHRGQGWKLHDASTSNKGADFIPGGGHHHGAQADGVFL